MAAVSESLGATADACAGAAEGLAEANKGAASSIAELAASSDKAAADLALKGGAQVNLREKPPRSTFVRCHP